MAKDLPYMGSAKNLPDILSKLKTAQTPPKFTHDFLKAHLGFSSSSDRPIIKVLKSLNFLTADSTPTDRYNDFRSEETSGKAMADGLREGWSEIFLADEQAHKRTPTDLQEIFKNVTGKSESVAKKMATTFHALTKFADFSKKTAIKQQITEEPQIEKTVSPRSSQSSFTLRNDIHIHLPPSSDVSVYTAIFKALREELLD